MAVVAVTYDIPSDPAQLQRYAAWASDAARRITAAPGLVWWQPFRSPQHTSPHVISIMVMESLEAAQRWAASPQFASLIAEAEGLGCSGTATNIWDKSPLQPEPMRP